MGKQHVDLTFYTPNWKWCEVMNRDHRTKSGERCKFCQEVKKRGDATRYFCLVYDTDLNVRDGSVVKCNKCMAAVSFDTDYVEQDVPTPIGSGADAQKISKMSLREHKRSYQAMRKEGYPEFMAYDLATDAVLGSWKETPVDPTDEFAYFFED